MTPQEEAKQLFDRYGLEVAKRNLITLESLTHSITIHKTPKEITQAVNNSFRNIEIIAEMEKLHNQRIFENSDMD